LELLAVPVLLGCLLLTRQGYVSVSGVSAFILPSPGAVLAALLRLVASPAVWRHVGFTALETGVGFLAATLLAIGTASRSDGCRGWSARCLGSLSSASSGRRSR
jgi:NitT/TauT family transport system permease protein